MQQLGVFDLPQKERMKRKEHDAVKKVAFEPNE
jgi:hypothetical protein